MSREWTDEQRKAASERMKQRNEAKRSAETRDRMRIPVGQKRDILSIDNPEDGYVYRIVNDLPGRIDKFKRAGYEIVEDATIGTSHVDGNNSEGGAASRDVGKGVTAYVMKQREDWYQEDQAAKQARIDEVENEMRRKKVKPEDSTDGTYGEVKIG